MRMRLALKIVGVLVCAGGFVSLPVPPMAGQTVSRSDPEDASIVRLSPYEVLATATRTEKDAQTLPVRTHVIGVEDIRHQGASLLDDLLRTLPEINVQAGGSFGPAHAAPALRGTSPNATLLLLDGRRLAGEVGNPFEMGRIPAPALERVEIVEGPLGTLYGADALGGVINLVTLRPPEADAAPGGTLSVQYGSSFDGQADQANAAIAARGRSRGLGYSFFVSVDDASPFTRSETGATQVAGPAGSVPPAQHPHPQVAANIRGSYALDTTYRDDARVASVGGRLDYRFTPRLAVGFDFQGFDEERESRYFAAFHPSAYRSAAGAAFAVFNVPIRAVDDNRRLDLSLDAHAGLSDTLTLNARAYRSDYRKRNATSALPWADLGYASEAASATTAGGNADVTVDAYEAFADWRPGAGHQIVLGADRRDERRFGSLFDPSGAFVERSVDYTAFYVQDVWDANERASVIGGVRHDRIGGLAEKTTARLGATVKVHPWAVLRANVAQGFRAPDIRELYIHRQTPAGLYLGSTVALPAAGKSPHTLRPESSTTGEVGIAGRNARFNYEFTLFRNEMRDRIEERVEAPVGPAYRTFRNVSRARIDGVETSAGWQAHRALLLTLGGAWLDAQDRNTGQALTFVPRASLAFAARWQPVAALTLAVRVRHVGSQAYSAAGAARTDAWTTTALDAVYRAGRSGAWELFGGFENIFDAAIDPRLGSDPGAAFHAGLRRHF